MNDPALKWGTRENVQVERLKGALDAEEAKLQECEHYKKQYKGI